MIGLVPLRLEAGIEATERFYAQAVVPMRGERIGAAVFGSALPDDSVELGIRFKIEKQLPGRYVVVRLAARQHEQAGGRKRVWRRISQLT